MDGDLSPRPALDGIRVLDLSRLLPGGFCSLLLADFGAEVVKVEDPAGGDYLRSWGPFYADGTTSAPFVALNRNKRSICVDLRTDGGRAVLLRLAGAYDVLLESFRPGVLQRLGLGYARLHEANPRLVHCAISGYGQDGPLRARAGHDINYLARSGMLACGGETGGGPVQAAGQIADVGGGGLMAAFAILVALRERERSGVGQSVDVSMFDGALSWLAMVAAGSLAGGPRPRRGGLELAGSLVCYRPYACADGWVTIGALEPKFWAAFCRGVGREDLIAHRLDGPGSAAHASLEAIFRGRTRAEWEELGGRHDCCVEPVLELDEALESELVAARRMVVEIDQPGGLGSGPVRQLGIPVKLSRTPGDHARRPGPGLGEHTGAVLREAGYGEAEIGELERAGVVGA